jgi:hypothetical protein
VAESTGALRDGVATLLIRAQQVGAVRADVQIGEVMALLISSCQGALQRAWSDELQRRTLAVIFDGLSAAPPAHCETCETCETCEPQDRGGSGFCGWSGARYGSAYGMARAVRVQL